MPKPLIKHTIVIWTEPDETTRDIELLAREAVSGGAYCSSHTQEKIDCPMSDDQAPSAEFFKIEEDELEELFEETATDVPFELVNTAGEVVGTYRDAANLLPQYGYTTDGSSWASPGSTNHDLSAGLAVSILLEAHAETDDDLTLRVAGQADLTSP